MVYPRCSGMFFIHQSLMLGRDRFGCGRQPKKYWSICMCQKINLGYLQTRLFGDLFQVHGNSTRLTTSSTLVYSHLLAFVQVFPDMKPFGCVLRNPAAVPYRSSIVACDEICVVPLSGTCKLIGIFSVSHTPKSICREHKTLLEDKKTCQSTEHTPHESLQI